MFFFNKIKDYDEGSLISPDLTGIEEHNFDFDNDDNLIINGEFPNDLNIYEGEASFLPDFMIEIKNRRTGQRIEKEI